MTNTTLNRQTIVYAITMAALLSGCASAGDADEIGVSEEAIYHGTNSTNLASGVVLLTGPAGSCTGTIYSSYWVLTAAHCIANTDSNGDGQITLAEGAGGYLVSPGPNASNQPVSFTATRVFRHPTATWGASGGTDTAMIWLGSPARRGFYTEYLSTYNYTNGKLNLYQGSTASLLNTNVWAFGYGPSTYGGSESGLKSAWKTVVNAYAYGYAAERWNNAGTSCPGDSGGPDYTWTGSSYAVTGVHNSGDIAGCTGGGDWQNASEFWRAWVVSTGNSCPDTTYRGRCHF